MNPVQRVVLCGTSVFLMAIEVRMARQPGMEVVRIDPHLPGAKARVLDLSPDVIIMERSDNHAELAQALLNEGLPLVEMDGSRSAATVLSGRQVRVSEMEDLVRVIEQIGLGGP